jgi:hypothetical protein
VPECNVCFSLVRNPVAGKKSEFFQHNFFLFLFQKRLYPGGNFVPQGQLKTARQFIAVPRLFCPAGTIEKMLSFKRPYGTRYPGDSAPGNELPGYSQLSLRDKRNPFRYTD